MKKLLSFVVAIFVLLSCFLPAMAEDAKISVVTTIFPIYDWVREIVGDTDSADISILLDTGVDLHSYQPTVQDILKVSSADVFAYVGGESDEWVEGALAEAANKDMKVVNLVEAMGEDIKLEEIVEGMEHEHDHDHEHEHDDEDEDHDDHDHDHEDHDGHDEDEDEDGHEHAAVPFEDSEVEDRPLSDFAGDWKSAYPYLLNGSLDEAIEHSAENGSMTVEEYHAYYEQGLKADAERLVIDENGTFTFYINGEPHQSEYEYKSFLIYWNVYGNKGVRYQYEAKNPENGVPKYVQISDHLIHPAKAEHLHVYVTDVSFEHLVEDTTNWPYYFPASMPDEELIEHFGGGHSHNDEDDDDHDHDHEDHDHDHDEHDHEHEHEHEEEADEHVWLSLRNAQKLVAALTEALCEADPAHAESFKANAAAYIGKLAALDAQYTEAVNAAAFKTFLFGDRFPFRYLADDYGLEYFAAFSGCSAESEASFSTIIFLSGKVDELSLPAVLTIENPHTRIAQTIVENTKAKNQKVLSLDSMQGTTAADIAAGATYLGIMESNLAVLRDALN